MKKILLGLFFAMFAMQVNAAVLTLTDADAGDDLNVSAVFNNANYVSGTADVLSGSQNHVWGIASDVATYVNFVVDGQDVPVARISLWLGAVEKIFDVTPEPTNVYSFSYLLAANTVYNVVVDGTGPGSYILTAETPIPAAVWLFGSALMGLFGASRRKSTAVAA